MKQLNRSLTGAVEELLIGSNDQQTDTVEVSSLYIANTYGADITISVYIEYVDVASTVALHGPLQNHSNLEKEVYYLIKDIVIPASTALDLVEFGSYSFHRPFALKMSLGADETADVRVDYQDRISRVKPREVTQY